MMSFLTNGDTTIPKIQVLERVNGHSLWPTVIKLFHHHYLCGATGILCAILAADVSNAAEPRTPVWKSERFHFGHLREDGTLHLSIPLGALNVHPSLSRRIELEHCLNVDSCNGREARSEFTIPALESVVIPVSDEEILWRAPNGIERNIGTLAQGDRNYFSGNLSERLVVHTPDGWTYAYDQNGLREVRSATNKVLQCVSLRGKTLSIQEPLGSAIRHILQAKVDELERFDEIRTGSWEAKFEFENQYHLKEIKKRSDQANPEIIHFNYENGLLTEVYQPGQKTLLFLWDKPVVSIAGKFGRIGNLPFLQELDGGPHYDMKIERRGIRFTESDGSKKRSLIVNPLEETIYLQVNDGPMIEIEGF